MRISQSLFLAVLSVSLLPSAAFARKLTELEYRANECRTITQEGCNLLGFELARQCAQALNPGVKIDDDQPAMLYGRGDVRGLGPCVTQHLKRFGLPVLPFTSEDLSTLNRRCETISYEKDRHAKVNCDDARSLSMFGARLGLSIGRANWRHKGFFER